MGYSGKNSNKGVENILLWKPPWNLSFFKFTPGNSRQNKAQPLDIPQICVRSLGNSNPRLKTKTHGNSTLIFLGQPWKLHFAFNYPLELPHAVSLISLEIPYSRSICAVWIFSGIAQLLLILPLVLFYYLSIIIISDQACCSIGR